MSPILPLLCNTITSLPPSAMESNSQPSNLPTTRFSEAIVISMARTMGAGKVPSGGGGAKKKRQMGKVLSNGGGAKKKQ